MRAALLTLLALTACVSEDQWSFPLSRAIYEDESAMSGFGPAVAEDFVTNPEAAAVLLLLPAALDVILLPITLPRDLVVLGGGY